MVTGINVHDGSCDGLVETTSVRCLQQRPVARICGKSICDASWCLSPASGCFGVDYVVQPPGLLFEMLLQVPVHSRRVRSWWRTSPTGLAKSQGPALQIPNTPSRTQRR